MSRVLFLLAAGLEAGYAVLLVLLWLRALLRASAHHRRAADTATLRPHIREALLTYLTGGSNLGQFRDWAQTHRELLIECLLEFRKTVSGGARDRLWDLGLELGLVHDWTSAAHDRDPGVRRSAFERLALACAYEPCRRVAGELQRIAADDPDPGVRLAAARGLAQSEDPKDAERAFQIAISSDLLARIILTEALRPHAVALCGGVVADTLRARDEKRLMAALEMVTGWGRAVPLFELHRLADEGSKAVRLLALRALPLAPPLPENRQVIVRALSDPDPEIALAAITAASLLQIREARQALVRHSRTGGAALAKAASDALAALPVEKEMLI
jgi:hypothetical protein